MPFAYIFEQAWRWFAETGINLLLLALAALLVPRAGRFANRYVANHVNKSTDQDETKSQLALTGAVVYIVQLIAFFLIFIFVLQQIGFSLAGAAIPATVVSAAIGFGAQNIIADFLAGFFILTEKQYGVGDYVTFQGNGLDISGDVSQITMRATTIRTINQAAVTIPNSAARIYINESNYWVNALVVIPIPLLGSESAEHAIERSERAARRAIARADIHPSVTGDLQVHPAVEVNPPSAAGLPWTVDMRFMVRVEPLSQWMVERAIRVAVLDEFWEEYGHAPGLSPLVDATLTSPSPHPESQLETHTETHPPTERMAPLQPRPVEPEAVLAPEPSEPPSDSEQVQEPKTVLNGLMRASTMWLLVAFAVTVLIRGLTLTPDVDSDADAGVLAPPKRTTAVTTATDTPAPDPAEVPTSAENPSPTVSDPAPEGEPRDVPAPVPTPSSQTTAATSESTTVSETTTTLEPTESSSPARGVLD